MTRQDTESAVLQWLDFDYAPPCDVRQCSDDATSTTKFVPHDNCQAHTRWYAFCELHTDKSVALQTACRRCDQPLTVASVLYL